MTIPPSRSSQYFHGTEAALQLCPHPSERIRDPSYFLLHSRSHSVQLLTVFYQSRSTLMVEHQVCTVTAAADYQLERSAGNHGSDCSGIE
jgi:hypothetical protein